jgi:hypothetical protein
MSNKPRPKVGAVTHVSPPMQNYPGYVCIEDSDKGVQITVRSEVNPDGTCGHTGLLLITHDEWQGILAELKN